MHNANRGVERDTDCGTDAVSVPRVTISDSGLNSLGSKFRIDGKNTFEGNQCEA
jgi:hypothetical protein